MNVPQQGALTKRHSNIRRLNESDAEAFAELRFDAVTEFPESNFETIEKFDAHWIEAAREEIMRAPYSLLFGAYSDNEIVACVAVKTGSSHLTAHKAHIWGLYVRPKFRNQGLGYKLIDFATSTLPKTISVLLTDTLEHNLVALRLFQMHGFSIYGREPNAIQFAGNSFTKIMLSKEV